MSTLQLDQLEVSSFVTGPTYPEPDPAVVAAVTAYSCRWACFLETGTCPP
jgi:hypothetical protein